MKLGTAIEKLLENYNYAVGKEWVQDKVAWALYHTWKEADDRKTEPTHDLRTETHECVKDTHDKTEPQICDTCRYYNDYIPCGSTPSACKEADRFAKEFTVALMKLKPQTERGGE